MVQHTTRPVNTCTTWRGVWLKNGSAALRQRTVIASAGRRESVRWGACVDSIMHDLERCLTKSEVFDGLRHRNALVGRRETVRGCSIQGRDHAYPGEVSDLE